MRPAHYFLQAFLLNCCLLSFSLTGQESITYENAFTNLRFDFPVEIQHAGDGSDRLFVVEQGGKIKVFTNNRATNNQATFLDLSGTVDFSAGQEVGLLGLAFHPAFTDNGYFYVYHTRRSQVTGVNVEVVLARYQVTGDDPNRADESSRLEIFSFDKNQRQSNHNGGKIAFGPDGYLYVSIGDGGGGGDPQGNAQNLNTVFGSILRIDVDLDGSNPLENNADAPDGNYEIPSDNPRVGKDGLDELYAWGIRNTWKFSFDNGRLWGGDVGQGEHEEINLIQSGGNYGWNRFEGNATYRGGTDLVTGPDVKPIHTYNHDSGDRSITLGYVYRGRLKNPVIRDKLIFGDYSSGRVWALTHAAEGSSGSATLLFRTAGENVSSFGLDEAGEIYFSSYGRNASLFKLVDTADDGPTTIAIDGVGSWSAINGGVTGVVEAVVAAEEAVYVAGEFTAAGGSGANNVATYTEERGWEALAGGADGKISALVRDGNGLLYAGGDFTTIGGVLASNVAVWNGSNWSALGTGTSGPVLALGVDADNKVVAGGAYVTAGGLTANNIAKWNGTDWESLTDVGTGEPGANNEVRSLAFDATGVLYVGGNFASAGGKSANRIATFDGATWGTLGAGTSGFVQAIAVTDASVFIGGNFVIAGDRTVNRVAEWDRATQIWQPLGRGVSGTVSTLVHDGNYLYAGGNFATATRSDDQNYVVQNVARWSTQNQWEPLGQQRAVGADDQVSTLYLQPDGSGLYAGGSFGRVGTANATGLARWGSSLTSVTPGLSPAEFELYPNPVGKQLTIKSARRYRYALHDATGRRVLAGAGLAGVMQLEVSHLRAGAYLLKLDTDGRGAVTRWIVVE
ncbi:PQQ-dependent sugar dehydrogenase [Neolewinella antarctica]|uniref:Uncharacterized protein n=1 Tax=Neolewinella antarctica TaxID=442734 RepID=A0ABX0XBB7_9BACT|nr:PQQ-dependent sugar dehydrogenase [Neolewinella antarctica]NJC26550.1 hypothetical protein [Neolewinella antarctica]